MLRFVLFAIVAGCLSNLTPAFASDAICEANLSLEQRELLAQASHDKDANDFVYDVYTGIFDGRPRTILIVGDAQVKRRSTALYLEQLVDISPSSVSVLKIKPYGELFKSVLAKVFDWKWVYDDSGACPVNLNLNETTTARVTNRIARWGPQATYLFAASDLLYSLFCSGSVDWRAVPVFAVGISVQVIGPMVIQAPYGNAVARAIEKQFLQKQQDQLVVFVPRGNFSAVSNALHGDGWHLMDIGK